MFCLKRSKLKIYNLHNHPEYSEHKPHFIQNMSLVGQILSSLDKPPLFNQHNWTNNVTHAHSFEPWSAANSEGVTWWTVLILSVQHFTAEISLFPPLIHLQQWAGCPQVKPVKGGQLKKNSFKSWLQSLFCSYLLSPLLF